MDAFERDPNTVNKALVLLGHQIEIASHQYDALSPEEKVKLIGELAFNGFSELEKTLMLCVIHDCYHPAKRNAASNRARTAL